MRRYVRRILLGAVAGSLLVCPALAGIINGSFETGDFTGWSHSIASWRGQVVIAPGGTDGAWHARIDLFGDGSTSAEKALSQNFSFTPGPYALLFDAWVEGDVYALALMWDDDHLLAVRCSEALPTTYMIDLSALLGEELPFYFEGHLEPPTQQGSVHLDNVRIVQIPEPAGLLLLSSGLVALIARRRSCSDLHSRLKASLAAPDSSMKVPRRVG